MKVYWKDVAPRLEPAGWQGLRVQVEGAPPPRIRLEACGSERLRFSIGGRPVLWSRIEDGYWGDDLLRVAGGDSHHVVPPITWEQVREASELPPGTPRRRWWAKTFIECLADAEDSPLSTDTWYIGSLENDDWFDSGVLRPETLRIVVEQPRHLYVNRDFIPAPWPIALRDSSPPDAARVKAWRKVARAGELPPVLLFWNGGLATAAVLDGHDRIQAALLEHQPVQVLTLSLCDDYLVPEAEPGHKPSAVMAAIAGGKVPVERANEVLLDAHMPFLTRRGQGYLVQGGGAIWQREVVAELSRQGIVDSDLLCGERSVSQS